MDNQGSHFKDSQGSQLVKENETKFQHKLDLHFVYKIQYIDKLKLNAIADSI